MKVGKVFPTWGSAGSASMKVIKHQQGQVEDEYDAAPGVSSPPAGVVPARLGRHPAAGKILSSVSRC